LRFSFSVGARAKARTGERNSRWKGGQSTHYAYATTLVGPNQYVHTHRLVAEALLGRPLRHDEHVHHIDGDKTNNSLSNLRIMSNVEHRILHTTRGRWAINYDACVACGSTVRPHNAHGLCTRCYQQRRAQASPPTVW
jgi:hypothetical protein